MCSLMSNAYKYPKPDNVRKGLTRLLGNGLLVAEGPSDAQSTPPPLPPSFTLPFFAGPFG